MVPSPFGLPPPLPLPPIWKLENLPPTYMLFQSPINMTNIIRQHSFPLLLDPPGRPDQQAIHCPTANFGSLSRGSVIKPVLITVFDI